MSRAIAGKAAPDWQTLIERGIERCVELGRISNAGWETRMRSLLEGDLSEWLLVAEQISSRLGWHREVGKSDAEWTRWLDDTVGNLPVHNTKLVPVMRSLGHIATVNYDDLICRSLPRGPADNPQPIPWTRAARWIDIIEKGNLEGVLHLHGCWQQEESVVFGQSSYRDLLENVLSQFVQGILGATRSLVFVGCGATFDDPNFKNFIDWMAGTLRPVQNRHYLLVTEGEAAKMGSFPAAARINILRYGLKHNDLLKYLDI